MPAAAPSCLAHLAPPGQPGVLYVGSRGGGGHLLQVPQGATAVAAAAEPWQALAGGGAAALAAGLAPVGACQAFVDSSGDTRLLLCCGEPPFCRLALGRLAASLVPLAVGDSDLPVSQDKCHCHAWPG